MRIEKILDRDGARRPRLAVSFALAVLFGVFVLPLAGSGADADSMVTSVSEEIKVGASSQGDGIVVENPLPGGRLTWRWGKGLDPWNKEEVFHRGIDVAAKAGTAVLAPADGVVIVATENFEKSPASGTVILIDHGNGWTTFFAHLGSVKVTKDQRVSRRDVIATVGSTGKSTGPHLHFEVRQNGEPVNPADFVSDWK